MGFGIRNGSSDSHHLSEPPIKDTILYGRAEKMPEALKEASNTKSTMSEALEKGSNIEPGGDKAVQNLPKSQGKCEPDNGIGL